MRVLLIEDDHATAQSIELMLKSEGFNVYTTDLGEEGIDLGKIYDYDLILLDLNLPDMSEVSTIIRHHHERFDGEGYPDGILNNVIPIGSRILAVAEDYDELQQGWLAAKKLTEDEALSFVLKSGETRYDPHVLAALQPAIEKLRAAPRLEERLLTGSELLVGQTLSRDFIGPDGYLWLSKEKLVSKHFIEQIKEYEGLTGKPQKIYVYRLKRTGRTTGR